MIQLKTGDEIAVLRENAHLLGELLRMLIRNAEPGVSTGELDRRAEAWMDENGVRSAFKGYRGYPAVICTSVNDEIVHGIPSDDRVLRDGDLLSLDVGFEKEGLFVDTADTVVIGRASEVEVDIIGTAREALRRGIDQAVAGNRVGDISHAIEAYATSKEYLVVRRFVGHGIGRSMHEEPQVPNYGPPHRGPRLKAGMVLAIEPMVWKGTSGEPTEEERVADDGWTVLTPRGQLAAHVEEMVLITKGAPEVLTNGGGR